MQFAHPQTLPWIAVALLAMAAAYLVYRRWRAARLAQFGDHPLIEQMAKTHSRTRHRVRHVSFALAVLCLGIAAAQPQWGLTNKPIKRTGVDIVFALDISKSMLARDAAPDRLGAAKAEIAALMQALSGDRVGLVVFTAVSFPQSPLTVDYGAIRFYLDKLDPNQMPVGGTSVGRAIMDANGLLTGGGDSAPQMKRAKNQIIVLISDGEDHESAPLEAADAAAAQGIKIVTVGFGSAAGERIPLYKADGTLMGYQRDRSGEIVRTRLDVDTMQEIARRTQGVYIPYTGQNTVAQGVSDFIGDLEKSELESLLKERYQDRFMLFLVPGFLFLLVGVALGETRRRKTAAVVAIVVSGLALGGCDTLLRDTDSQVDRGIELIENEQYADALASFGAAEERLGSLPEIAFNKGVAQLGAGATDDAQALFARALESPDTELRLKAMNNLGVTLGRRDAWKDAFAQFQEAMVHASEHPDLDPDLVRVVRKNLEFAWRKVHPPCADLEDAQEDNDVATQATVLEQPDKISGSLCPADADWFRIPTMAGAKVTVTATFKDLRDDPDPDDPFIEGSSDFRVSVRSPLGPDVPISEALGAAADHASEAKKRRATRSISEFVVTPDMLGDQDHLLLAIQGTREARYDIDVRVIPPCSALQEASEPNNSPEGAKPFDQQPMTNHVCPGDEDWFTVDVAQGDSVFVDVRPGKDPERETMPALRVEILDAARGVVLSQSVVEGEFVTAGLRDLREPATLLIRVFPQDGDQQGPYELSVYHYLPCVVGNDRFEPNDTMDRAVKLDGQTPQLRYLRLCDGDLDIFTVPVDPKKKSVNVGLALTSYPRDADEPDDLPELRVDLVGQDGRTLQIGERPETTEDQPPMWSVLKANDVDTETAMLRVSGDSDFYHLILLDGQQGGESNQDSPQQDKQDSDSQQPDGSNKDEDDSQGDAPPEEEGKDEGQGGEQEAPANQGDQTGQNSDDAKSDEERAQNEPNSPTNANTPGEEVELQRIDDILKALETTDDNFQMRKALKELPNRFIDKDW